MTSSPADLPCAPDLPCPAEQELIDLVDDALPEERADEIVAHLVDCDDCRGLLARSEAALCYALGGLADAEPSAPVDEDPQPVAYPRRLRLVRLWPAAAAVAAVAALLLMSTTAWFMTVSPSRPPPIGMTTPVPLTTGSDAPSATDGLTIGLLDPAEPPDLNARLDTLLARAQELSTPPPADDDELLALAALGAAEARVSLDRPDAARAHLARLVDDFPETTAAHQAAVRLRELEQPR